MCKHEIKKEIYPYCASDTTLMPLCKPCLTALVSASGMGCFQALLPDASFVRTRQGRSTQRLRGRREELSIQPESKDLCDFARLPAACNRGSEPRTSNLV